MRRALFFAAFLISGAIGLAIIIAASLLLGVTDFVVTLLIVVYVIFILVGLIGGALAILTDNRHEKRC